MISFSFSFIKHKNIFKFHIITRQWGLSKLFFKKRQLHSHFTRLISWLLMSWWRKEPGGKCSYVIILVLLDILDSAQEGQMYVWVRYHVMSKWVKSVFQKHKVECKDSMCDLSRDHFKNAYELFNLRGFEIFIFWKLTSFNVWARYFVWNFKGYFWNSTQNI